MTATKSFKEFKINSFEELILKLKNFALHDKVKTTRLYRGHQETNWELLPKIGRPEFRIPPFLEVEKEILNDFRRMAVQHNTEIKNYTNWDLIALAQHHGLPTRLLDWTSNPLAALWFAFNIKENISGERCIWGLAVDDTFYADLENDPFTQARTVIFRPNHVTNRITAQSGWFTNHKYLQDKNAFIPFEKHKTYAPKLAKFTFANNLRIEILKTLELLGVNNYTMFPDLDGLTAYIEWRKFKKNI
jgi:FRG domain